MKGVNDFSLGIVSLVLWRIALANTRNLQLYEQKFTSYNIMIDFYIGHAPSCVSDIFCSAWCTNDQDCVSFMFDAETSKCTTFSNYVQCESGEHMQHFYVKTGLQPKLLCGCNLAYNSSFVNVALGKPVVLSTTYEPRFPGSLMVDGNRHDWLWCSHTVLQLNPFALIDLQQSYSVFSFYLVNRFCCPERLHDLKILVGDDPNNLSVCIDYPTTIGRNCTLRVPTRCQGRYVKLQLFTTEYLNICEVEVYSII